MSAPDHDALWRACRHLPEDYEPWGQIDRDAALTLGRGDCSCGCRWFVPLERPHGYDWGVCANHDSPRAGLLTFEHQGCLCFEPEDSDEA